MTKYYVANENGDWWTMDSESKLFVVAVDDVKVNLACESLGYDVEGDKFERVLWNIGDAVALVD
jgi:hypothetical protein